MTFGEKVKFARLQLNRCERGLCEPNYEGQKAFHDFCEKNHVKFED